MITVIHNFVAVELSDEECELVGFHSHEAGKQDGYNYRERFRTGWSASIDVNLAYRTDEELGKIERLFRRKAKAKLRGFKVLVRDIETWRKARSSGKSRVVARSVEQFEGLTRKWILGIPDHWLFQRTEGGANHVAYYVNDVEYHPKLKKNGYTVPAHTDIGLVYVELGKKHMSKLVFEADACRFMTVAEALAKMGYVAPTKELLDKYHRAHLRFLEVHDKIGVQFLAIGMCRDDRDGNTAAVERRSISRSGWGRDRQLAFGPDTVTPAKVVVDVLNEVPTDDRQGQQVYVDSYFWERVERQFKNPEAPDEDDDEDIERIEASIPVHPYVTVFNLGKSIRVSCHVQQLQNYKYNRKLVDSLILPQESKDLIATLVKETKSGDAFEDIVEGKGGGITVLLSGRPGVGKTLTAEVFAEASGRPLYAVQAAQLGIDAIELEAELTRVLARASRWSAVCLIDEADVYIRARDNDLNQNAICGAFLRVLEYQTSHLFMTTNRPDSVDDAIISRCVAHIPYVEPTPEEQVKIWEVLSAVNGYDLGEFNIARITAMHNDLTGRDIKQLLKLGRMVADQNGGDVDRDVITFVRRFRPALAQRVE